MTRIEAANLFESYVGNECYTDKFQEACAMAIAALKEQESRAKKTSDKKTSEWISVEERLPEKDKDVMCYSNKNGGHMFFGYRGWISGEWMEGGSLHIGDVTHWMPLPDAPEVEG